MIICAISDVHVKTPYDDADKLLTDFFNHPVVQKSDYVLLLGDIFDLMAGSHPEYLKKFAHLFSSIDKLIQSGKKVYYAEGNHDVHLAALFKLYWKEGQLVPDQFARIEEIQGKFYYFSHGDEHEIDNLAYQRYKWFLTRAPLKFFANNIMPYWLLNFLGERASKISRKNGYKAFNEELVRERFRKGVQYTTAGNHDFVLGGHSHVKDHFRLDNGKTIYLNNGHALRTKTFICIEDHQPRFEVL